LIVSAPGHTLVGEDTLGTGEHVLLFLSASSLIDFASYNNMDDLYNKIINDSSIKFGMIAKYDIKSEKITYRNREGNLTKVKENINTVLMTVHSNLSTAK
jgi:hypothetical protein